MTLCFTCTIISNLFFVEFFWNFFVPLFHVYGDITIAGEGLQILTYARHFWLLSNEGSLECHT